MTTEKIRDDVNGAGKIQREQTKHTKNTTQIPGVVLCCVVLCSREMISDFFSASRNGNDDAKMCVREGKKRWPPWRDDAPDRWETGRTIIIVQSQNENYFIDKIYTHTRERERTNRMKCVVACPCSPAGPKYIFTPRNGTVNLHNFHAEIYDTILCTVVAFCLLDKLRLAV